jgi:hypothetical protein
MLGPGLSDKLYRTEPSFVFAGLDPAIHDEAPRIQP